MNIFRKKIIQDSEVLSQNLAAVEQELETLNKQFLEVQEQLKQQIELNATLTSELQRINEENVELKEDIVETTDEVIDKVIETEQLNEVASIKAVEILAEVGQPPVEIVEEEVLSPTKSLIEQLNTLKGKERQEFYNKNKQAIFKLLRQR